MSKRTEEQDGAASSLSVEESNRLRASLGLPPLRRLGADTTAATPAATTTPGQAPGEDADAVALRNYRQARDRERAERERVELLAQATRERERSLARVQLKGPTLADAEEEEGDDSAATWIRRQKERSTQHQLAQRQEQARQRQQQQQQQQQRTSAYKAKDLSGLRVGHDVSDFQEGSETILVLRDTSILEQEREGEDGPATADELVGVDLLEQERARENLERRKGIPTYQDGAYAASVGEGEGQSKGLLAKYDDPEGEAKRHKAGFVLQVGSKVAAGSGHPRAVTREHEGTAALALASSDATDSTLIGGRKLVPLGDGPGPRTGASISDYLTREEEEEGKSDAATFKKSTKSSKGRRRQRQREPEDEEARPSLMDLDRHAAPTSFTFSNKLAADAATASFVDDDDLQAALAKSRRANTQRLWTAEEVAEEARQLNDLEDQEPTTQGEGVAGAGLVISEAVDFVRNLGLPTEEDAGSRSLATAVVSAIPSIQSPAAHPPVFKQEPAPPSTPLKPDAPFPTAPYQELGASIGHSGGDVDMTLALEPGAGSQGAALPSSDAEEEELEELLEEPLASSSMGATVALLAQKGYIKRADPEELKRERQQMERKRWIVEERLHEAQRQKEAAEERERIRAINRAKGGVGGGRQDTEERYAAEEAARLAELARAREVEERFKHYNPDVTIKYHDDFGRELGQREAYKFLSYKFHGKTSGKTKLSKRLQKLQEELQKQKMSSSDTPLNMALAVSKRTAESGSAHIVLSVGNRKSIPEESVTDLQVRAERLKAMKAEQAAAKKQQRILGAQGSTSSRSLGQSPSTGTAISMASGAGIVLGSSGVPASDQVATTGTTGPMPTAIGAAPSTATTTGGRAKITFGMSTGLGAQKRKQNPNVVL